MPSPSTVIALCTLAGGLTASVLLTPQIAASAGRAQLVYTVRVEDKASMNWAETLGVAAGAFRGIVVNYLWLRATEMKDEGKYFEAVDLARTITKLEPRFPRVWAFHAWNLAYNISVATQTPEERWNWVNSGIRLLRDEGIPANPNDMLLHKELAWIYLHKVQGRMDDANNFYKSRFADEWATVMGPFPQRGDEDRNDKETDSKKRNKLDTRAEIVAAMKEYLQNIAGAPDRLEEIAALPNGSQLIDELKIIGADPATETGRLAILRTRALDAAAKRRMSLSGLKAMLPEGMLPLLQIMNDARYTEVWPSMIRHVRKRVLIDQYHMEPDRMIRYTDKYGPLDWRHPAAHALYWAARGVEQGLARVGFATSADYDFINTDRIVIHCLQELYRSGQVVYDPLLPQYFQTFTDEDFIESYQENLQELADREVKQMKETKNVDMEGRIWTYYNAGYENFVADAASYLFRLGQLKRADDLRLSIAKWRGRAMNDPEQEKVRLMPLEDYVMKNVSDRITSPDVAVAEVSGSLRGAYYSLLAGDDERFNSQFEYAKRFHMEFFKEQHRVTNVARDRSRMAAMDEDFRMVAAQVLAQTISVLGPADGTLLYTRAPLQLQQFTYELLSQYRPQAPDDKATDQQKAWDRLYPVPEGYKEFAAARAAEKAAKAIEQGRQEQK
ncbi:MAG: hypothetical protein ACREJO_14570 [Phycisphaerales bacterium]